MVIDVLNQGFVPVLHGDCIFDLTKGCVVLSGDTIIKVHIHDSTDLSGYTSQVQKNVAGFTPVYLWNLSCSSFSLCVLYPICACL